MAGKINPYDYEPEYSDDEDIGNVNVDKYEIRNSADVMTRLSDWVIPCQINRWFPLTPSDSFEIWHTCRNCLETNIRQIVLI